MHEKKTQKPTSVYTENQTEQNRDKLQRCKISFEKGYGTISEEIVP